MSRACERKAELIPPLTNRDEGLPGFNFICCSYVWSQADIKQEAALRFAAVAHTATRTATLQYCTRYCRILHPVTGAYRTNRSGSNAARPPGYARRRVFQDDYPFSQTPRRLLSSSTADGLQSCLANAMHHETPVTCNNTPCR